MEIGSKFEYQEPSIDDMYAGWCWDKWVPEYPLKPGYTMYLKDNFPMSANVSCMNGHTREYCITDENGVVVAAGTTCACGRGCYGLDCIADSWEYHDTSIESFRE